MDACVAGLGLGSFLHYQVAALLSAKKLKLVLEPFEPAPLPIHLIYPNARLMSPRLRAVIDWLRDGLRADSVYGAG